MFMVGSVLSCLLAVICLVGGVGAVFSQRRKLAASASAAGTVVELHKRAARRGELYFPTVQFSAPSGEVIQFDSAFGSMPAPYQVGQAVKVHYDPRQPHTAEVDSAVSDWLYPGCLLAFAVGAGLFSLMFLGTYLLTSVNH